MIDPGTIALAASAFAAVKKGIAFAKDVESMHQDISRWMSACHDIETKHNKVKRKKGQSVAEEAMETWAAVRKIRQQREELRLYMLSINPQAWNDFVRLEGQIRKARAEEAEARRRQIKKTVEVIMVVLLMVCIGLAFGALVWWALHLKEL